MSCRRSCDYVCSSERSGRAQVGCPHAGCGGCQTKRRLRGTHPAPERCQGGRGSGRCAGGGSGSPVEPWEGAAGGAGCFGRGGRRSAGGRPTPSIRQSGRRRRPACGAAASRAAISGSARRCCNWEALAAASGISRTSQPRLFGRLGGGGPDLPERVAAALAGSRPARTRAASEANRTAVRRSRDQSRMISGPARPRPPRAARARHSTSIRRANLSAGAAGRVRGANTRA